MLLGNDSQDFPLGDDRGHVEQLSIDRQRQSDDDELLALDCLREVDQLPNARIHKRFLGKELPTGITA